MKKTVHPAIVALSIVAVIGIAYWVFARASGVGGERPGGLTPPPELLKAFQEKGNAAFDMTVPQKSGAAGTQPIAGSAVPPPGKK